MVVVCAIFSNSAWATNPNISPYISTKIDVGRLYASNNFVDDPINIGFAGAVGLHYRLTPEFQIRAELEASLHSFSSSERTYDSSTLYIIDSYEYKQTSVLANFYIDRGRGAKLKPYVMVGIGVANFNETAAENTYVYLTDTLVSKERKDKGNALAFVFGAGFSFDIISNLEGDVGVRYMVAGDRTILSPSVGIRYAF